MSNSRGRWESIGFAAGLLAAAELADDWAINSQSVASNMRRKMSAKVTANFNRTVAGLDPDLLRAYVTEQVAAGVIALGRALKVRSQEEVYTAFAQDEEFDREDTPVTPTNFDEVTPVTMPLPVVEPPKD